MESTASARLNLAREIVRKRNTFLKDKYTELKTALEGLREINNVFVERTSDASIVVRQGTLEIITVRIKMTNMLHSPAPNIDYSIKHEVFNEILSEDSSLTNTLDIAFQTVVEYCEGDRR